MKILKQATSENLIFLPGVPTGYRPAGFQVLRFVSQDLTDPLRDKRLDPRENRAKLTVLNGGGGVA